MKRMWSTHQTLRVAFAQLHVDDDDINIVIDVVVAAVIRLDRLWWCEDDLMGRMLDTCRALHVGFLGLRIVVDGVTDLVGLKSLW
jgi:hypothetical protein